MNNKEFIAELALRTGYTQDESQKMVRTVSRMKTKPSPKSSPKPPRNTLKKPR